MDHGERFNSYSHLVGLVLALAGGAFLVARTLAAGDPAKTAAVLAFTFSAVALYAVSTAFHSTRGRAKEVFRRADHCAIYLLIAGTYTPLALLTLEQPWGRWLLCAVWAGAAFGIWRELRPACESAPSLPLYLVAGWVGVLAATPIAPRLDAGGLAWLLAGAALYTAGTVFYRNRLGLRHAHGIWHLFVVGGTLCHYVMVARIVL